MEMVFGRFSIKLEEALHCFCIGKDRNIYISVTMCITSKKLISVGECIESVKTRFLVSEHFCYLFVQYDLLTNGFHAGGKQRGITF